MANLVEYLTDVADAIRTKDGSTEVIPALDYPDRIRAIPTGPPAPKEVNFYTPYGDLVASYTIAEAQALTALPTAPVLDRLVFQEWNYTLAQVKATTMPLDVGGTYTTASGNSEFDITLTAVTGLNVTVRIYNESGTLTVNWGDGATDTSATIGVNTITHTYAAVGNYTITVDSTGTYYPYGSSTTPYNMFNVTPNYTCTAVRLSDRCTQIGGYAIYSCYSLTSIVIPASVTSIGNDAIYSCFSLTSIVIPASVTSIGGNAFANCYIIMEYIFNRTTPPTLSSTSAFTNRNGICRMRVPKGSLNAYQTATNWATLANHMEEMA